MKELTLKEVGEHPGFCSKYYKDSDNNRYVKVTHPKTKVSSWHTASSHSWEPEYPVTDIVVKDNCYCNVLNDTPCDWCSGLRLP